MFKDPYFWNSLQVTLVYTLGVTVLSLPLGLLVALGSMSKYH